MNIRYIEYAKIISFIGVLTTTFVIFAEGGPLALSLNESIGILGSLILFGIELTLLSKAEE